MVLRLLCIGNGCIGNGAKERAMNSGLSEMELAALHNIGEGRDPFGECHARGDYGKCMLALASLRRAGLIDHHDHLTDAGRGVLTSSAA